MPEKMAVCVKRFFCLANLKQNLLLGVQSRIISAIADNFYLQIYVNTGHYSYSWTKTFKNGCIKNLR